MRTFWWCLFAILFVTQRECYSDSSEDSVLEDASLTMPQLVTKYGYPIQTHKVQTADGYILTLHRIPFGRECPLNPQAKIPVLVQHGLFLSSFDWVILGPGKSLGYILADACYDVWLGNNRGTKHSREHVIYSDKEPKFWDFSWHEMGIYDLPAEINYILQATQKPALHYIGHSEGTTQFLVFNSFHPEYRDRIMSMQALSIVAFMKHLKSPIVRLASLFQSSIEGLSQMIGMHEFVPENQFLNFVGHALCKEKYPHIQQICSNTMFLLVGFDDMQLNKTILPAILGHTPSGGSARSVFHYCQGVRSGKFRQYDYGIIANLRLYNSNHPPDYNLTRITAPIAVYHSKNDWLASQKDVKTLIEGLPNVIEVYEVPYPKFSHTDYIYASNASHLLYNRVLEVMSRFNR